jgi:hypothetical protein
MNTHAVVHHANTQNVDIDARWCDGCNNYQLLFSLLESPPATCSYVVNKINYLSMCRYFESYREDTPVDTHVAHGNLVIVAWQLTAVEETNILMISNSVTCHLLVR